MCRSKVQAAAALAWLTALVANLCPEPKAASTRIVHLRVGGEGLSDEQAEWLQASAEAHQELTSPDDASRTTNAQQRMITDRPTILTDPRVPQPVATEPGQIRVHVLSGS